MLDIELERALALLAAAPARRGRGSSANVLHELGEHPDGGKVQVLDGRYGPYVKHGKINATIPKDTDPASVTLEQAVEMLAAKAASKASRSRTKKTSTKKTSTKKTVSKKSTAKKSTAKKSTAKRSTASKKTASKQEADSA